MKKQVKIDIYDLPDFVERLEQRIDACRSAFTLGVEQGRLDMIAHLLPRELNTRLNRKILDKMHEVI